MMFRFLRRGAFVLVAALALAAAGCGSGSTKKNQDVYFHDPGVKQPAGADAGSPSPAQVKMVAHQPNQDGGAGKKAGEEIARKVIYTADLRLVVEDLDKVHKELAGLIKKHGGYVEDNDIQGKTGAPRSSTWKIRVPSKSLEEFRDAVKPLGVPEKDSLSSKDVTEEFYDTKARVENQQKVEKRLQEYLDKIKDTKDILKDVLIVEKELARVRGDIELMQSQLKRLDKLAALTTINLSLVERQGYVPPQAPSFATTVGRTFQGSIDALVALGQALVLIAVALAPWLPLIAVAAAVAWWLSRRSFKTVTPPRPEPQPPAGPG